MSEEKKINDENIESTTPDDTEEEGFFFDDDDNDGADFVAPKNFKVKTDHNKVTNQKWFKTLIVSIVALIVAGIVGFLMLISVTPPESKQDTSPSGNPSPSEQVQKPSSGPSTSAPQDVKADSSPLADAMGNPQKPKQGKKTVTLNGKDTLVPGSEKSLKITGASLTRPENGCEVSSPTSFCLAGYGDISGIPVEVYYFKDIAHSMFFNNPKSFKVVEGGTSNNTVVITDISFAGNERKTIVIGRSDASGFMITSSQEQSEAFANKVVDSLK